MLIKWGFNGSQKKHYEAKKKNVRLTPSPAHLSSQGPDLDLCWCCSIPGH